MSPDGRLPDRDRPVGRAGRPARPTPDRSPDALDGVATPGLGFIRASWAGSILLAVVVAVGIAALDQVGPFVVAVSAGLFLAGSVAFFAAYAGAVARSRYELIGIGGLYFMAGTAPSDVRRSMMGSLAVQVGLVVVAVAVKPFSSLVFTSLAPIYGLGLAGWWTSRHGTFASKDGSRTGGAGPPSPEV